MNLGAAIYLSLKLRLFLTSYILQFSTSHADDEFMIYTSRLLLFILPCVQSSLNSHIHIFIFLILMYVYMCVATHIMTATAIHM